MSNLPFVGICTAAAKTNVDLVWAAMGRGDGTFGRKVCAIDPEATWEEPATHYLSSDTSATDSDIARWQALCSGDLPEIEGQWGVNGVISSLDAQNACTGGNLLVASLAGAQTSQQWLDFIQGVLSGQGLQYVPDEPI